MGEKYNRGAAFKNARSPRLTMLKTVANKLTKANLSGWQIRETKVVSDQAFLAKTARECTRTSETTFYTISIYKKKPGIDPQKSMLGLSHFKIGPAQIPKLDYFLNQALASADLVHNEIFDLPTQPPQLPHVDIVDPTLSSKTLVELEDSLIAAVEKEKEARLSSAEFFVDRIHTHLMNHHGLDVEQEETIIQTEFILLAKSDQKEKEFINRTKRRFLSDFDLAEQVKETAKLAREATLSQLPKTGEFPVLLSGEPLDHLFNPLIALASARLKYNKMIHMERGKPIIENDAIKGDKITIWSNGTIKGMMGSSRFDSFGSPTKRTCLIEENILKNYLADKRYADYLNVPVTGELGNIEIPGGRTSFNDLFNLYPDRDKPLYHLTAFSAFEPNPITGAFSAEIRSGYEISKKALRPIKGGSVSGLLSKDLLHCFLSKEQVKRERYLGPKGILFQSLEIAGSN